MQLNEKEAYCSNRGRLARGECPDLRDGVPFMNMPSQGFAGGHRPFAAANSSRNRSSGTGVASPIRRFSSAETRCHLASDSAKLVGNWRAMVCVGRRNTTNGGENCPVGLSYDWLLLRRMEEGKRGTGGEERTAEGGRIVGSEQRVLGATLRSCGYRGR